MTGSWIKRLSAAAGVFVGAATAVGLTSGPAAAAAAIRFHVVPARSHFFVHGTEAGLVSATRNLAASNFSGEALVAKGTLAPLSVTVRIKVASLHSSDDLSQSDRDKIDHATTDPILDAAHYPDIVFKGTRFSIKRAGSRFSGRIFGNLTLHGVTRPVMVPVTGQIAGTTITVRGSLSVNQTDYKIELLKLMGGVISVRDEASANFDFVVQPG